jgi:hypothetical protein
MDAETIEDRLDVLEAAVRRETSEARRLMEAVECIVKAVIAHGDAELSQQVQTVLTDYRATGGAVSDATKPRCH